MKSEYISPNRPHPYELADILREHMGDFPGKNSLCPVQKKTIADIIACRTSKMKGHLSQCSHCGYKEQSYNSCRNRHCNKCQFVRQTIWADALQSRLLPVKYFHLVFTIPDILNPLVYLNQEVCYSLLYKVAWSTLGDLCNNPQFLGARIGAVAILHTWSSTLLYHPHIHMLVTDGGITEDAMEWVPAKNRFLVPVKLLSRVFKARFCEKLKLLISNQSVRVPENTESSALFNQLYKKDWVVYAKKPGKSLQSTIDYLARYIHRVAIGNDRIEHLDQQRVTFRYKDPKTGLYNRYISLEVNQFIDRFLKHILPHGFFKIRYFGILSSVHNKELKQQCLALMQQAPVHSAMQGLNPYEAYRLLSGKDPLICKSCKRGKMIPVLYKDTG
jgi:hypothetical protein